MWNNMKQLSNDLRKQKVTPSYYMSQRALYLRDLSYNTIAEFDNNRMAFCLCFSFKLIYLLFRLTDYCSYVMKYW